MPTSATEHPGAERKRRPRKSRKHHSPEDELTDSSEIREGTEDAECCAEKTGKPKCSACASGKPCSGRGDALTSQDYLTACDLGIADRSRPYIRARLDAMNALTPATLRTDKKCGASAIPDNKKCHVGSGGPAGGPSQKGSRLRSGLETAGMVGGTALAIGGVANSARQVGKGNLKAAGRSLYAANAGSVVSGLSMRARGKRTGNAEMVKASRGTVRSAVLSTGLAAAASGDLGRAGRAVGKAAAGMANRGPRRLGTSALAKPKTSLRTKAGKAAYQASYAAGRAAGGARNAYRRAGAGVASYMGRRNARRGSYTTTTVPYGGALARRDTIWADGFSPDLAALGA